MNARQLTALLTAHTEAVLEVSPGAVYLELQLGPDGRTLHSVPWGHRPDYRARAFPGGELVTLPLMGCTAAIIAGRLVAHRPGPVRVATAADRIEAEAHRVADAAERAALAGRPLDSIAWEGKADGLFEAAALARAEVRS